MYEVITLDSGASHAKHSIAIRSAASCLVLACLTTLTTPAQAVDGCLVLLCFAAPSWRAIPQCVPPVTQVLRDLARGRPFPTCAMAGAGNASGHAWASVPDNCPPQYVEQVDDNLLGGPQCRFAGAVSVTIGGELFSRTWWHRGGDTSTEFSPAAKAQLGQWDPRFDDDYAAWRGAGAGPSACLDC